MKVTICGPNLTDQSKGQFHIHAAGCADLRRSREPEYANGWTIDAVTREQVAIEVYADQMDESPDTPLSVYVDDFHFFPCCAALPTSPNACRQCGIPRDSHPAGNGLDECAGDFA